MKKFLGAFVLLCLLMPSVASAKKFKWTMNPEYSGEVHIGYGSPSSNANAYMGRIEVGTVQGLKLNEYATIGLGVDVNMLTHYYKGQDLRWGMNTYFDMRGFYPLNKDFSCFLDLGLGAYFNIHPSTGGAAFFCEFGPGVKYKQYALSLGLQNIDTGKGTSTFFIKAGYHF